MSVFNIGVLDQHELFRESLSSLLASESQYSVSFNSSNFKAIHSYMMNERVQLLIMDPGEMNEELLQTLRQNLREYPGLKIMILTDHIDKEYIMKLIEFGVSAIYSKKISPKMFLAAIRDVIDNQFQFDVKLGPKIREKLVLGEVGLSKYTKPNEITFSRRELQVLDLICQERTNQEISEILNLSVRTIETHRRRMIEKTESKNMIGVVMYAFEKQLIQPKSALIA